MAIYDLNKGITGGGIGVAVAEAIVHDIRVNATGINGFPQITVAREAPKEFLVGLQWERHRTEFILSDAEAEGAIKRMKAGNGYDPTIFDRIQEAYATLEHRAVNDREAP